MKQKQKKMSFRQFIESFDMDLQLLIRKLEKYIGILHNFTPLVCQGTSAKDADLIHRMCQLKCMEIANMHKRFHRKSLWKMFFLVELYLDK